MWSRRGLKIADFSVGFFKKGKSISKLFFLILAIIFFQFNFTQIVYAEYPHLSGWYVGDMHVHSEHSEHEAFKYPFEENTYPPSIQDIASRSQELGLEFIAITDHSVDINNRAGGRTQCGLTYNQGTWWYDACTPDEEPEWDNSILNETQAQNIPNEFIVIRGEEVGVFDHSNLIGNSEFYNNPDTYGHCEDRGDYYTWYDIFREVSGESNYFQFVNHPYSYSIFYDGEWECWDLDIKGIEILNGHVEKVASHLNDLAIENDATQDTDSWIEFLQIGKNVVGVSNSDAHNLTDIGAGRTYVYLGSNTLNQDNIISALNDGKVVATTGPLVVFSIDGTGIGHDSAVISEGENPTLNIRWNNSGESGLIDTITVFKNGLEYQSVDISSKNKIQDSTTWSDSTSPTDGTFYLSDILSGLKGRSISSVLV